MVLARLVVRLLDVPEHGNREANPPCRGDDEGDLHCGLKCEAEAVPHQDDREAHDEGHHASDVAPGIALARDLVHSLVARRVDQQRVVKDHGAVEHHRRDNVDDQKRNRLGGEAQRYRRDHSSGHGADDELLLHAAHVGDGAEDGHEKRDHQRGDGLSVAPRHQGGAVSQ